MINCKRSLETCSESLISVADGSCCASHLFAVLTCMALWDMQVQSIYIIKINHAPVCRDIRDSKVSAVENNVHVCCGGFFRVTISHS